MATYSLPQPVMPFGNDNRGFTDPLRYSRQRPSPPSRSIASERAWTSRPEPLPGLHHILSAPPHPEADQIHDSHRNPGSPSPSSLLSTHGSTAERPRTSTAYAPPGDFNPSQPGDHHPVSQSHPPQRDQVRRPPPPPGPYPSLPHPGADHYRSDPGTSSHVRQNLQSGLSQSGRTGYPMHPSQQHNPPHRSSQATQSAYPPLRTAEVDTISPKHEKTPTRPASSPHQQQYQPQPQQQQQQQQPPPPPQQHRSPGSLTQVKLQPRVISEDVLPGEGAVWVYEDGSTVPKEIDGEPVNAQWGVTKAGKPRKRLAVACTTCREKKIKCDPAEPKCAQCEKFGRECRYSSAPRSQRPFLPSPSRESHAGSGSVASKTDDVKRTAVPSTSRSSTHEDLILFKRRNSSPEINHSPVFAQSHFKGRSRSPPVKKRRSELAPISESDRRCCARTQDHAGIVGPEAGSLEALAGRSKVEGAVAEYHWDADPRLVDPALTTHFLDMYFIHVNTATHHLFPRELFMQWVRWQTEVTGNDRMVLYAMLALGALFSLRSDRRTYSDMLMKIAKCGLEGAQKDFSIQLAHTQVLSALYSFAVGEPILAWDFVGSAVRAVARLKLNLEEGCQSTSETAASVYGLRKHALTECRRRTFWSVYILDRFCEACGGHLSMIQSEDALLRLPCDEDMYSNKEVSGAPFFDNGLVDAKLCKVSDPKQLGPMAHLVQIISIWGDLISYNSRRSCQEPEQYSNDYEEFYMKMTSRLSGWLKGLPRELQSNSSNAALSVGSGAAGHFVNIHAIYHAAAIRLNRSFYHRRLSPAIIARNISKARRHAQELLELLQTVHEADQSATPSGNISAHPPQLIPFPYAGSIPFVGHAAMLAVDVLSAGGRLDPGLLDTQISSISAVLGLVDEVSRCWFTSGTQKQSISDRLTALKKIGSSEIVRGKKAWKCIHPLDPASRPDQDVFYPSATNDDTKPERGSDRMEFSSLISFDIKVENDEILVVR